MKEYKQQIVDETLGRAVNQNKTSDAQIRATMKYREKMHRLTLDFSPAEKELWEHLQAQPQKATYIKNLIRQDMKGEK